LQFSVETKLVWCKNTMLKVKNNNKTVVLQSKFMSKWLSLVPFQSWNKIKKCKQSWYHQFELGFVILQTEWTSRNPVNLSKVPIPRLRISISIRIAYAYKKSNQLNNVGAILVVRISIRINFVRIQLAYKIA